MKLIESTTYRNDLQYATNMSDFRFLADKKVLITGGTGLIGSAIIDLILANNECNETNTIVYAASRTEKSILSRFGDSKFIVWVEYDALKPVDFLEKVDFIIHCAGNASPELYVSKAVETMLMNFTGLNNLLSYAKKVKPEGVLYLSSSEIYGRKEFEQSYSEEDFGYIDYLQPRSSYASSKIASETLSSAYASEYGIRTLIARPGHIYGPTASPKDKRVSSSFAYDAANGKNLTLKSTGSQVRSYMYCLDCARAILMILEKGVGGEAYNVCGKESISIKKMASILAKAGNVELTFQRPSQEELSRFNPMDNASLNYAKIHHLGFDTCFSAEEGLTHTVSILREMIGRHEAEDLQNV